MLFLIVEPTEAIAAGRPSEGSHALVALTMAHGHCCACATEPLRGAVMSSSSVLSAMAAKERKRGKPHLGD